MFVNSSVPEDAPELNLASDNMGDPLTTSVLPILPLGDLCSLRAVSKCFKDLIDSFLYDESCLLQQKLQPERKQFEILSSDCQMPVLNKLFGFLGRDAKQVLPTCSAMFEWRKRLLEDYSLMILWNRINTNLTLPHPPPQNPDEVRAWMSNPDNTAQLNNITNLDLAYRGLQIVPQEIRYLTNLKYLGLSNSRLTQIDANTFSNLTQLIYLNLSNNRLTQIDANTFSNLTQLTDLCLDHNQLTMTNVVMLTIALLESGSHSDVLRRCFSELPEDLKNKVYREVYEIATTAGSNTNHHDFGRVAFEGECGYNVSDEVRIQVIEQAAIEYTELFKRLSYAGECFQNDDTKSGLEIFTKLSPGIQNAVYGCTYELEKNSHPAVGNPRFGELAFLQKEGLDVSNATRATAIENFLKTVRL